MTLPPGQRAIRGFPRFGTHFHHAPPAVPADPAIQVGGSAVDSPFAVGLAELARLPRREVEADFHCVAGWSAMGLRWEGVPFAVFLRELVEPVLGGAPVTHVVFGGLDGYWSLASIEDALADDVLIADRLEGRPLGPDHGAPVRLVSPRQYGFISTKHLCRVDLLTEEPADSYGAASAISAVGLRMLGFNRHSRSRVWEEERHGAIPNALARPLYRFLTPPIAFLSSRGAAQAARDTPADGDPG